MWYELWTELTLDLGFRFNLPKPTARTLQHNYSLQMGLMAAGACHLLLAMAPR